MKTLLEQIDERLAVCAKATPGPWTLDHQACFVFTQESDGCCGDMVLEIRGYGSGKPGKANGEFTVASRNQREGELAALKCAVEALEKPYICSVCGDRSKERCGRVCDGDESSCCKYFLNFDQALAQITKLMEGK